jgi:hypothetical protein
MRKSLLFGIFFMATVTSCLAQGRTPKKRESTPRKTILLSDAVYRDAIRSVQLFAKTNEFLTPAIALGTDEKLTLKFDDLSGGFTTYSYTFMHCNADWEQSSIFENQFMDGFFQNEIQNYKYAVNTKQTYTSYSLEFPNSFIKFTASGNYVLFVYENGNKNKPILTRLLQLEAFKLTRVWI